MKDKIIELKNVGVYYSPFKRLFNRTKKQALKDISFSLFRGETLGVLGRNGAGKSTLLKLLAGVIEPDTGQILKAKDLTVSLLALQAGFDNELSGRDNIYLSGLLLGFDEKTVKEEFNSIIEFAEIEDIDLPLKAYSTGMRARLGFSIAYKLQPDVLLIDEVLGVGDAHFKEKSINAMKSKLRSEQTVVLVSHHGPTIQNLCKRAVWIENGVVHMEGNAQQVVKAYEDYIKG